jgi:hypothetical protein
MQIILQATHGIVSGSPDFFRRAFGDSVAEFEALLARPEKYVFNRVWFEELDGRAEFEEYCSEFRRLSQSDRAELLSLLSTSSPSQFKTLCAKTGNATVMSILRWYEPLSEDSEQEIWRRSRLVRSKNKELEMEVPADELVEDAGLAEVVL